MAAAAAIFFVYEEKTLHDDERLTTALCLLSGYPPFSPVKVVLPIGSIHLDRLRMRLLLFESARAVDLAHYQLSTNQNTMGYLKAFREHLTEKLALLDSESRKEIINYASNACLESYRNGQKAKALMRQANREAKKEIKRKKKGIDAT